jgi:preprotein translocase subunit YajC
MQPAQPSMLEMFMPFVIVLGIMYFLMIRPQSKRMKQHEGFLKDLKRGDEVLTNSGILGKIDGMTEQFVILEIADGVKVRMLKKQVAGPAAAATASSTQDTKKNG